MLLWSGVGGQLLSYHSSFLSFAVVRGWWSAIVLSFAVVRGWWSAIVLSCWWSILHEFFRRTLSRSFREKSLIDLVCFCSPYAPPYPKAFFPWPTKKKRRNNGGLGPESPEAIHSDPDDGELVSVVKEALANLDHALLERQFFWGREGWIYCFGPA